MEFLQYIIQAPVSLLILLLTLATSLYSYFGDYTLFEKLIFQPFTLNQNKNYYSFITSGFLHGDLTHLAVNSVCIFYFAFPLEHKAGSLAIALLYIITVMLCNLVVYIRYKGNIRIYNLGASGALVAIIVSHMILDPAYRVKLFFIPATVPGVLLIGAYISYLYYLAQSKNDNVNHEPHLIGAITGLVFTLFVHPAILDKFFAFL